jgi:hypothetical protein
VDWFRRNFSTIDPRTLGFFRIVVALLLLADLTHRLLDAQLWYANDGLLPNHTGLWRPIREWVPSIFWGVSHGMEARALMTLVGLVYLALLVGYRTRLAQVLSLVAIISLQVRVDIVSNGGDFVLSIVCFWTAFLPLGKRFSLDALIASARRSAIGDATLVADTTPITSLAVTALSFQFAAIYFFNTIQKDGGTWRDGTAIYYLWQHVRQPTALAVWARDLPIVCSQWMTWGTLLVEGLLPALILLPFKKSWLRPLAIVLVFLLHSGISLSTNLGVFSYVMMVFSLLLLQKENWDWLQRNLLPRVPALSATIAARTRLWRDWLRTHLAHSLRIPIGPSAIAPRSAFERRRRRALAAVREGALAFFMLVATLRTLEENRIVPAALKPEVGRWHQAVISYTRLQQGWQMFAPDVPKSDTYLRVDAITADGRHIDPIAEAAGTPQEPEARTVPEAPNLSVYFVSYMQRIRRDTRHHRALSEWIQDTPARTGREKDAVVSFIAYELQRYSPAPGDSVPARVTAHAFLQWTKP